MAHVESFPPLANPDATRLILGSMPGKASLAAGEYYAHPQNKFWPIAGEVLGFNSQQNYAGRCRSLLQNGVALWDVLKTCFREGSLDSAIDTSSIVPNDFRSFFDEHPRIRTVYFNGTKSEQIFHRHVLKSNPDLADLLELVRLPSTSPANASISMETKMNQWRRIAQTKRPQ